MSPFTQLSSALTPPYSSSAIDRNFSPLLSYIDEFDRHFSHRHRFMNCFVPRFDLEEDAEHYYLFGELPGAKVEDIGVEVREGNRLVVWGRTTREAVGGKELVGRRSGEEGFANGSYDNGGSVNGSGNGNGNGVEPREYHLGQDKEFIQLSDGSGEKRSGPPAPVVQNRNHVLLSERLVGEFNRTFAFPMPILEEEIQASMDNGVLKLVVPKQLVGGKEKMGRRIEVLKG